MSGLRRGRRVSLVDPRPFGDTAVLFAVRAPDAAGRLSEAVRSAGVPGVVDVVGGLESVLVHFDPNRCDADALAPDLVRIRARRAGRSRRTVVLRSCFDGPDLEEVGRLSGLGAEGVRHALCSSALRVSFLGFTPGFAYLSGLPGSLETVPRRASPRQRVPAGSVALAGGHAAVYPQATPGGWQLVGRTDAVLFDPDVSPYAVLRPGDAVRFEAVEPGELTAPSVAPGPPARRAEQGVFTVHSAGTLTTLQDRGRLGFAHLGVPRAGAADPVSYSLANALLGNLSGSACLEVTAAGPELVCRRETYVAVVGGDVAVTLDRRPVGNGRVVPVAPGQRLQVGQTGRDLRAYVAVRGGFATPAVLGSRSSDRLVGLGGGPLAPGDELAAGEPAGPMADHLRPEVDASSPDRRVLRVLPFGSGWSDPLFGPLFSVEPASDRVGIRLRALDHTPVAVPAGPGVSAGTTTGTVQVPPDGNPVVLGPDHATVGGYPVGGVVISADWAELGRCRPGDRLQLVPVDDGEADVARRALERSRSGAVVGQYPLRAD